MSINLELPKVHELKPRIVVIGVGGAGGNAINNMIASGLLGVEYIAANTDAQALLSSSAERRIQLGANLTEGLGAGSKPEIGEAAAEEAIEEISAQIAGAHMVFIAAGMGGGTGTGAAAVIARAARDCGVLTVGIVTKPFKFEGTRRLRTADAGIAELRKYVDTLIVIPNQNLFRIATEKTTFAEAFVLADQVLYSGVACIVDLIIKDGLINLDFADVRTVMSGMGTAMMGTGEAAGERRALRAAEEAISNPLLDEVTLKGAKGVLLSIIGGRDMTLYEVDEAASRVREEVDPEANIIVGATFDENLSDHIRVAIVASGMHGSLKAAASQSPPAPGRSPEPRSAGVPPLPPMHANPPARTSSPHEGEPGNGSNSWPPPNLGPAANQPKGSAGTPAPMHEAQAPPIMASATAPRAMAAASSAAIPPSNEPRELWRAPGNVVIEEARPPQPFGNASRIDPPRTQPPPAPRAAVEPFKPAQPEDPRRPSGRRVPGLEEFPAVGQRDYQAKAGRYDVAPHEPQVRSGDDGESQRRGSLLQRMIGSGRRNESAPSDQERNGSPDGSVRSPSFFNRNKP